MLTIKATAASTEYPIVLLTESVRKRVESWYDNGKQPEFAAPGKPADSPDEVAGRTVNTLYWPVVGASRFAYATVALASDDLQSLRADLAGGNKVTLSYADDPDDEDEVARTFPLYLLASRPVSRPDGAYPEEDDPKDLWLLTLVDKRWYWTGCTGAGDVAETTAPASWTALFSSLFGRLPDGAYSVGDSPDGAYLTPGVYWSGENTAKRGTAYMIDEAARSIGSRIVTTPSGTVIQRPTGSRRTAVTTFNTTNLGRLTGGGLLDSTDLLAGVPKRVRTVWPDGTEETVDHATGVATASLYADIQFVDTATGTQRATALTQWATDAYAWADAPLEAIYAGFLTPPSSGFVGSAELFHDDRTGYTRVSRPSNDYDPNNAPFRVPDDPNVPFQAILTTSSGGLGVNWKWRPWALGTGGTYSAGTESADYNAVASPEHYGVALANPSADQIVWMKRATTNTVGGDPQYEFSPHGYATTNKPGILSADLQNISGVKRFEATVVGYNGTNNSEVGFAAFQGFSVGPYTSVIPFDTSPSLKLTSDYSGGVDGQVRVTNVCEGETTPVGVMLFGVPGFESVSGSVSIYDFRGVVVAPSFGAGSALSYKAGRTFTFLDQGGNTITVEGGIIVNTSPVTCSSGSGSSPPPPPPPPPCLEPSTAGGTNDGLTAETVCLTIYGGPGSPVNGQYELAYGGTIGGVSYWFGYVLGCPFQLVYDPGEGGWYVAVSGSCGLLCYAYSTGGASGGVLDLTFDAYFRGGTYDGTVVTMTFVDGTCPIA